VTSGPGAPPTDPATAMQTVLRKSWEQTDQFHASVRAFRNRLVITSLITIVASASLVIVQWRLSSANIFQLPKDSEDLARWAAMLLIMLFGSVGALVTAIPSMAAIPRVNSPYNFPLQQALVKITVGSLSALVGVIAIGNPGVSAGFSSLSALLGIAAIFGAGQQAVTHFLDNKAKEIIESRPAPNAAQ
jgi:hypothetical protein